MNFFYPVGRNYALTLLLVGLAGVAYSQCALLPPISSLGSQKFPDRLCAPVTANVNYHITFSALTSAGPTYELIFIWGDGTAPTTVPLASGTNDYNITVPHPFPANSDCEYQVITIMRVGSELCTNTRQTQVISTWRTDEFNGGDVKLISPTTGTAVHEVCEGDAINVTFEDLTDWNCNGSFPANYPPNDPVQFPNEQYRWQQIVYNTPIAGTKIPNLSVGGVPVTGAGGADLISNYQDIRGVHYLPPLVVVGDGDRRNALTITAPGGVGPGLPQIGDEFEVTIRYWNICNPYDNNVVDGFLNPVSGDLINGDNPPVERTALIRIVDAPDMPQVNNQEICFNGIGVMPPLSVTNVVGGMTYRWYATLVDAQNNTNIIHTGANFTPTVAQLPVGANDFFVTATTASNCVSAAETAVVTRREDLLTAPPTLVSPQVDICPNTAYVYRLPNDPVAETIGGATEFIWSIVPAASASITAGQGTREVTVMSNGTTGAFTLRVVRRYVNPPFCASNPRNAVITVRANPNPNIVASTLNACEGDSPTVEVNPNNPFGTATHAWTGTDVALVLSSTSVEDPTILATAPVGTYNFTYTLTNSIGCSGSDNVTIVVNPEPTPVNAGSDQTLCFTTLPLSTAMTAQPPTLGTGSWSYVSGPDNTPTFFDAASPTSTVSVDIPGLHTFQWSVTNGGCTRTATVNIDFGSDPAQPVATGGNFCGLSGTVSGNAPTFETATWIQSSGPGTLSFGSASSPNTTVSATLPGTYQVTWRFRSGGCEKTGTTSVTFNPAPDALDPAPSDLCELFEGTLATTNVNLTSYNAGVIGPVAPASRLVRWYASIADRIADNRITTPVTVTTGQIFYTRVIDVTSPSNCPADGVVTFTVNPKPAAIDQNVMLCEDGPGSNAVTDVDLTDAALKDDITLAAANRTVSWFTDPNDAEANLNPISNASAYDITGNATVYARVVNDLTGCYNVAEVNLVVNPLPLDQPILGTDAPCVGTQVLYRVNPVSGAQYQWTVPPQFGSFGGTVNDFYVLLDFTSPASGDLRLRIVLNGCEGNEIVKTITPAEAPHGYTIGGPPVACEGTSVEYEVISPNSVSSTYNWQVISQATGLPGGGVVQSGQSTNKATIQFEDENVALYVTEISPSNCPDNNPPHMDIAINQQPSINMLTVDICSGFPSGINITRNMSSPVDVDRIILPADPFVSPGLTATTVTSAGEYPPNGLANDAFKNITGSTFLPVVYRVIPKSADGCEGDERLITLNVKAEPAVETTITPRVCSGQPIGLTLSSPSGFLQAEQFVIEAVSYNSAVLTPAPTNSANLGMLVSPTELANDRWTNLTTVQQTVVYQVRPYSLITQCFGDPAANVSVIILPNPSASLAAPAEVCDGQFFTLDFAFYHGREPYVFDYTDGTNTFSLTGGSVRPVGVAGISTSTQYTLLSVKDYNGCEATTLPPPVPVDLIDLSTDFTISPAVGQCSGGTFTFNWTVQPQVEYTWIWNDGTPDQIIQNPTGTVTHSFVSANVNSNTAYPVMLVARSTSINSCFRQSASQNVIIFPSIFMTASANKDEICSGDKVTIANSTAGGTQHVWFVRRSGVNEELQKRTLTTATTETFKIENTSAANRADYEIVYRVSNGNCADEIIFPVAVYKKPKANFEVAAMSEFLGGNARVNFRNLSNPVNNPEFTYSWNFGADAVPGALNDNAAPPQIRYTSFGPKNVRLSVANDISAASGLACTHDTTHVIQIILPPLVADFRYTPHTTCFPADISITENLATGDLYEWTLKDDDGNTMLISNDSLPTFRISSPGNYSIFLKTTNSITGQSATKDNSVTPVVIFDNPFAAFEVVPDTVVFTPDDTGVEMRNYSMRASEYLWDFGDGETAIDIQPRHFYQSDGTFTITLTASQNYGRVDQDGDGNPEPTDLVCRDMATQRIVAKPGGRVKVPNAFTPDESGPNGGYDDGQFNDVFRPVMDGVEEFQMEIFDRWGNLIFQSIDKNQGWDGYDKHGKLMPAGVYVYKLTMRLSDSQRTTQIGDVTLIR